MKKLSTTHKMYTPMPFDELVLVDQEITGFCLRTRTTDELLFDEHNNFDDSELKILHWQHIPTAGWNKL